MFEIRRKIFHIIGCLVFLLLIHFEIVGITQVSILLIVGVILSFISIKYRIPVVAWFLKMFDRPNIKLPGKGALSLTFGIFLLLVFIPDNNIIYASIMILAFGDAFNALIGTRLKKTKHLIKTKHPIQKERLLEGTLWGIIAATLASVMFVSVLEAVLASTVAMLIESLEIRYKKQIVDDNVLIPVAAALTIVAVRFLFWA